jgi:hypothetical protein
MSDLDPKLIYQKASILLRLLTLCETLLPAVLMAWLEALRSKNSRLQNELDYEKLQAKIKDDTMKVKEENANEDPEAIINAFLGDKP